MHEPEAKPTVLLIDDAPDIHRLLAVRLKSEDVELIAVGAGEAGIARAREERPALILLDLNMPGMDGFAVLRALKDDASTMDIPVIVISASEATDDKVTGLDLGAIDYVCKPFNHAELRARVRSALRIHELMQLLAQKAQIDGLTGLWNRTYFDKRLTDELAARERTPRPLALAMCDLDSFKTLNDTHGHASGDAVLQGFARILQRNLRRGDVACRYGGEEFGLILRETDAEQARAVVERIRAELESTRWPRHPERVVTASFGVCDHTACGGDDPLLWIETADRALYMAKQTGRNRVCVASVGRDAAAAAPLSKAG